MTFDSEAWKKKLLDTGDYDAHRVAVAAEVARNPHEYYLTRISDLKLHLDRFLSLMQRVSRERIRWILRSSACLRRVIREAHKSSWKAYLKYINETTELQVWNMESMRRILRKDLEPHGGWWGQIQGIIDDLDEGLNLYQHRLIHYCSLAVLAKTGSVDLSKVRKRDAAAMESVIDQGGSGGCVLGEEYRHMRNAIGHKWYHPLDEKQTVTFQDFNPRTEKIWEKVYTVPELLMLYARLSDWIVADGLAQVWEGLVVYSIFAKSTRPK